MVFQEERITEIGKKLHQAGMKLTPQRRATVSTLLEYQAKHLSAEELFTLIKQEEPEIGLATVYRTLDLLTELRIADRVTFEDGVARYDLRCENQQHFHHHLLCSVCGKVEEIHEDLLVEVEQEVLHKYGFKVQDHRLTFHGVCSSCSENTKQSEHGD
ncbi:ferric uptake regulation protein [Liquorilactobacillus aquaticus DSM 21051]|uniref:Ferric uptake regulation protein n=1 Tax=Liquorilactobacillus aquaticus DSM 21051 TaxID=1423725 RepID=A0A0R2CWS7_9LACO|nr:Fur family transcriptional regulator [Liquorilactobacillus aquaticus]KRM96351.1 ferric uptake regulation protein [Liquorilactobacillus aquaticus DSM 21051]